MIYAYVGLPGSGKSYLAVKDRDRLGGILLDDLSDLDEIFASASACPEQNIFITSPHLCQPAAREALVKAVNGASIQWFFFENNWEKAMNNIEYRNDRRIVSKEALKHYFSKIYVIPEGVEVIPIWNKE